MREGQSSILLQNGNVRPTVRRHVDTRQLLSHVDADSEESAVAEALVVPVGKIRRVRFRSNEGGHESE